MFGGGGGGAVTCIHIDIYVCMAEGYVFPRGPVTFISPSSCYTTHNVNPHQKYKHAYLTPAPSLAAN